jgi:thymidylate synthase (FAD)
MRVVTAPSVYVYASQVFRPVPLFPIPEDGTDATKIGAFSAKICYRSKGADGRSNEENQRRAREERHGRVMEHIVYSLYITGISRALGNELITHKPGMSLSQESTRYVSQEDAGIVLEPLLADVYERVNRREPVESAEHWLLNDHLASCRDALRHYEDEYHQLVAMKCPPAETPTTAERKWARGKARNVLPLALETTCVVTGNLRAWRWFLEVRSSKYAEHELRRLAYTVYQIFMQECPLYFEDYVEEPVTDSKYPALVTPFPKV